MLRLQCRVRWDQQFLAHDLAFQLPLQFMECAKLGLPLVRLVRPQAFTHEGFVK